MKKRILIVLPAAIAIIAIAFALIFFLLDSEGDGHVHTLTHHSMVEPTCTESGALEFWECDECEKKFLDSNAQTETVDTTLPARHKLSLIEGIEPTCFDNGNKEHWKCSACSAKFTDASAKTRIYNVFLPAEHIFVDGICQRCNANGSPELIYERDGDCYTVIGLTTQNLFRIVVPPTHNSLPVTAVAEGAFDNCTNLRSVELGKNIIYIPQSFLSGCDKLLEIVNCTDMEEIRTTFPDGILGPNNKETRVLNFCGFIYYIDADDAILYDYLGPDTELVFVDEFVLPESFRLMLPNMLKAQDFEGSILIPMLERYESLIESHLADVYPDTNFSFLTNDRYVQYKNGCLNAKTNASDGVVAYLADMRALVNNAFGAADPARKEVNKLYGNIVSLIMAYAIKNPAEYDPETSRGQEMLERMYRDYPITKDGTAVYVYAGSSLSAAKVHFSDIINEYATSYTFELMCEQEMACGFDRMEYYMSYDIADKALLGRNDITGVLLLSGVRSVGFEAFAYCGKLKDLEIYCGSIGHSAFRGCEKLENITLGADIDVQVSAFDDCKLKTMTIGASVTEFDVFVYDRSSTIEHFTVHPDNKVYRSVDGNIYTSDGKTLVRYAMGKSDESFTVPSTVEVIGEGAFTAANRMYDRGYWPLLKKVTIPSSVNKISTSAFEACTIEEIILSEGLVEIGDYAFSQCEDLRSVTIPSTVKAVSVAAFAGCDAATVTVDPENTLFHVEGNCLIKTADKLLIYANKNSVIPNDGSVTVIATGAFSYSPSLVEVTIPESVLFIMSGAFYRSDNLESVVINGENIMCRVRVDFHVMGGESVKVYTRDSEYVNDESMIRALVYDNTSIYNLCRDFDNIEAYMKMYEDFNRSSISYQ